MTPFCLKKEGREEGGGFIIVKAKIRIKSVHVENLSLEVMQYNRGQFVGNHGLSYIITNLTMVAIWRSNGYRIRPLIAGKRHRLLV